MPFDGIHQRRSYKEKASGGRGWSSARNSKIFMLRFTKPLAVFELSSILQPVSVFLFPAKPFISV